MSMEQKIQIFEQARDYRNTFFDNEGTTRYIAGYMLAAVEALIDRLGIERDYIEWITEEDDMEFEIEF